MFDRIDKVLKRRAGWQILLLSLLFIGFLAFLDFHSGVELSFSIFYLLPVSIVAWYIPRPACYFYAFLAATVWDVTNVLAGQSFSHPVFYFWNGGVRLAFFLTVCALLRRLHHMLRQEREFSRRDHRTGLFNGRAFHEALGSEHSRSVRGGHPLGLAFIDLDHFKKVNDELGHAEGDRVLVQVARTLEANLRRSDVIARMGGDEFAIILPECGLNEARVVGAKLVNSLRELSARESWPVRASVGLVVNQEPKASDDLGLLLKASDHLMYRVKEQGRDAFLVDSYTK